MSEMKKYVESILNSYMENKNKRAILAFEIKHLNRPMHSELVENLTFSRAIGEKVSTSKVSNPTADIAVNYTDSCRDGIYQSLCEQIDSLSLEIERLEYYLSLLPYEEAEIIKLSYFEKMQVSDICKVSNLSKSTLQRRKTKALNRLIGFYSISISE